MRIISMMVLLVLWGGCTGNIDAPAGPNADLNGGGSGPKTVVTLMFTERSFFAEMFMLDGCTAWAAKDVGCNFTEDPLKADAFISFDRSECVVDKDNRYTLAIARWSSRDIVLYTKCLERAAGDGEDMLTRYQEVGVVVAAHELGHLFGIWDHVPASCTEPHTKTEDGIPVCGVAAMNPLINTGLRGFITAYDAHAFDLRRTGQSLVDAERRMQKSVMPQDCTLRIAP